MTTTNTLRRHLLALTFALSGLLCTLNAHAAPATLADAFPQALAAADTRAKSLGADLVWLRSKRADIDTYLHRYWATPCEEALVLAEPALHAGELILTVACKRGQRVELERAVPERNQRDQRQLPLATWAAFAEQAAAWDVAAPRENFGPELEAELRQDDRQHLNSLLPLLALYRDGRWHVLPMRLWETADLPMSPRSRWQEAVLDFSGADRNAIAHRDQKRATDRQRYREDQRLFKAVLDHDPAGFRQAYDDLNLIARDAPPVYDHLAVALAQDQDEIVRYALQAGTPARPADLKSFAAHLVGSYDCNWCPPAEQRAHGQRLVARWLALAEQAGGSDAARLQTLRQDLTAAVDDNVDTLARRQRDDACRERPKAETLFLRSLGKRAQIMLRQGKSPAPTEINSIGVNLLYYALQDARAEALVRKLLDEGIDAQWTSTDHGLTALMLAAARAPSDVTQRLLDLGLPVDARAKDGSTALMLAASAGRKDNVALLIKAGADRRLRNHDGRRASDIAQANGHADIAQAIR